MESYWLLAHYWPGHFERRTFAYTPMDEILGAYRALKTLEMRAHYPVANLHAGVLNFAGGKGEGKGEAFNPNKHFGAFELLPAYAQPEIETPLGVAAYPCSVAVARGVLEAFEAGLMVGDLMLSLAPRFQALLARAR